MSSERPVTDLDLERLSAYLDGELSAEERSALEARLQAEPTLRRELSLLRQTVALIQTSAPYKAPRDFTLTPEMLRARQPRVLFFPATALVSTLSAVAAIVLVVAGLTLLNLVGTSMPMSAPVANNEQQVAAAVTNATTLLSTPTMTNDLLRSETTESRETAQQEQAQQAQPEEQDLDTLAAGDFAQVEKTATTLAGTQMTYYDDEAAANQQAQIAIEEASDSAANSPAPTLLIPPAVSPQDDRFGTQDGIVQQATEAPSLFAQGGGESGGAAGIEAEVQPFATSAFLPTAGAAGGFAPSSTSGNANAIPAQPSFEGRTAGADQADSAAEAPMQAQNPAPEPTMGPSGAVEMAQSVPSPTKQPSATPTPIPTATAQPTEAPTDTATLTATLTATNTATQRPSATNSPAPTATQIPLPTATSVQTPAASPVSPGVIGVILVVAGIMAFGLFALTLAARRRSR